MLKVEVLIGELVSVDGLSTGSVSIGEVATLGHEAWDDSVEVAALEVEGLSSVSNSGGAVTESCEVLDSLGHGVAEETEDNAA